MDDELLQQINKYVKNHVDEKRYVHTLGVAYTACALAMCHGANIQDAKLAGFLHDSAKCMTTEKKIHKCEKYQIKITKVERDNPFLLHGKVGACLSKYKFGIENEDILNAVTYHTTGRPGMSMLEKIIYIADYIEPNRNQIPGLDEVRALAFKNLDATVLKILENTLNYLKEKGTVIDAMSQETYEYYKKLMTDRKDGII